MLPLKASLVLADAAQGEMTTLRRIARNADAPVVVARGDVERALDCLGPAPSSKHSRRLPARRPLRLPLAA
ncbi:hypothetical protein [Sphingomonas sp.]|uniref:hypothetical protein n=1 Tax=Sphingomonas sp. TaxID=28214 RepID=UPI003F7E130C